MASPDAHISIYRVPNPAPSEDVARYTHIHLSTLKTNPEAFSATFEDAAKFTPQQWNERVNADGRTTFAARRSAAIAVGDVNDEWLGTLSVLHPRMLRPMTNVFPHIPRVADQVARNEMDRYLLIGVWVHPRARGKGVAQMMIKAALDIVKAEPGEPGRKMVFLELYTNNIAAKTLYTKLGFMEDTDCQGITEGHTSMTILL